MNLIIKAERRCVGCDKVGHVDIEVRKIEAGLMFVDWSDYNYPEGWVQPHEWQDEKLQRRRSWKEVSHEHIFCSQTCMYTYYEVDR